MARANRTLEPRSRDAAAGRRFTGGERPRGNGRTALVLSLVLAVALAFAALAPVALAWRDPARVRALRAGAVEGRAPWPRLVLELLAAFDRPGAARALGLALLHRRPDEGQAWLERAARRGDARAAFALALSLRSGDGGPRRPAEALFWLEQAADGGFGAAHFLLGTAYRDGDGVAVDQRRALAHFEAAAAREDAPAIQTLAEAYRSGELGLPRDPERAEALRHELEDAAREPRWPLEQDALDR